MKRRMSGTKFTVHESMLPERCTDNKFIVSYNKYSPYPSPNNIANFIPFKSITPRQKNNMKRITFQCDYEISDMSEEQHRETMTLRIHNTVVRESKLMLESPTFLLSHSRSTSTLTNLSSSDVNSYMGTEYESFGNSYHFNNNTPTNASNSAHNSNTVTSAMAVVAAVNHNVNHNLVDVNSSIVATNGSAPTTELPIHQVTGCIFSLSFPSLFVSLEGSCAIIDHLFEVFSKDEFMKNILCLRVKFPIRNRFYSEYVLYTFPYFRSHSSSTYTVHSPH